MRIFITLPDFDLINISGSGEIISETFLNVDDIDLTISGSGDIDLGIEADDIKSSISGSGNILLEGTADEIDFRISGSGDYGAFNLDSNRAYIEIIGSGDAEVYVGEQLDVKISGSVDVMY